MVWGAGVGGKRVYNNIMKIDWSGGCVKINSSSRTAARGSMSNCRTMPAVVIVCVGISQLLTLFKPRCACKSDDDGPIYPDGNQRRLGRHRRYYRYYRYNIYVGIYIYVCGTTLYNNISIPGYIRVYLGI